jgi:hypothetical protein
MKLAAILASMAIHTVRRYSLQLACFVLFTWMLSGAQTSPDGQNKNQPNNSKGGKGDAPTHAAPGAEYSGMYGFLRDGEFVQITVEDQGHVIGFVSRYADAEGNGGFLEHFFESGKLDGTQLSFTTKTVQGVSFEFKGAVERGEGKSRGDEAYYVLKGNLVENKTDDAKKTSSISNQVVLKSFPQDLAPAQPQK